VIGVRAIAVVWIATTNWGLFISRTIANDDGGSLEIESTLGRGTTARLSLPRAS